MVAKKGLAPEVADRIGDYVQCHGKNQGFRAISQNQLLTLKQLLSVDVLSSRAWPEFNFPFTYRNHLRLQMAKLEAEEESLVI